MPKRVTFLLLFSLCSVLSTAQLMDHKFHLYGRCAIGGVQNTSYYLGSLNAEILFKKFGLNYNFDYQMRKDAINQFHTSMGILGAPTLLRIGISNVADDDTTNSGAFGILGGLLLFALPDGMSYHFSPTYKWDISPYINILGLDFIKDKERNESLLKYACSFGVKSTYVMNELLTFTVYTETRHAARYGWGFGGGMGVGVLLGKKHFDSQTVE
jgi:hypothetical protein